MTSLSLAARNLLAHQPEVTALLPSSASWDTWIASEEPVGMAIENTSKCMIVISEGAPWTSPNEHNTLRFPTLLVDIWADPSRNPDKSVKRQDAKDKIVKISTQVNRHMHRVDSGSAAGGMIFWGSAVEIAAKMGVPIFSSVLARGPQFEPVQDSTGSWMGRYVYNIKTI